MWVILHSAGTLLLAIVVFALCRGSRLGPAARHALWLLVLLKLLIPPFVAWPWPLRILPADPHEIATEPLGMQAGEDRLTPGEAGESIDISEAGHGGWIPSDMPRSHPDGGELAIAALNSPAEDEYPAVRWERWGDITAAEWLYGGIVVASIQLHRLLRIRRWLAQARPASPWLVSQVEALSSVLGVRPPRLAVLPGIGSPLVWAGGRTRLLWPEGLEDHLTPEGARAVLVHELAHLARRDHWVGWLILVAGWVWWWHPLFYFVRRQLNRQAELACDARVVALLPDARRSYAEALLDVCQRQSWTAGAAPVLGVAGRRRDLERRLVMIMRANVPSRLSPRMLVGLGLLGLVVLPSWTLGQVNTTPKPTQTAPSDRDNKLQTLEYQLQGVLTDLETQRKAPAAPTKTNVLAGNQLYAVTFTDSGTVTPADRDKKLQDLEAKVKALLKEVHSLRTTQGFMNQARGQLLVDLDGDGFQDILILNTNTAKPVEVTLIRSTYKLPAAKAEALGKFLQQHVKAAVMETKVDGESLIVTTTPEVQRGISQFVGLMEGKTPQAPTRPKWSHPGQPGQQAGQQAK